MISQKTAIALGDLYGTYFGRIYGYRIIQSKAKNSELADFLFKTGFQDEWRRKALSRVAPSEVKEFILSFYSGKFIKDTDEYLLEDDEVELSQTVSLALAQAILNEVSSELSTATDSFCQQVRNLVDSLKEDGYFFYQEKLLTNTQLTDEFGVFYNSETKSFIDMQESNKPTESPIPNVEQFLLEVPLYKSYDLDSDSHIRIVHQLGSLEVTVDSYCLECDLPSTFKRTDPYFHSSGGAISDHDFQVVLLCTRSDSHRMKFYFRIKDKSITKVGQFPTLADLVLTEVKKYRRILGDRYGEFTKAIGLAAHGVGVGSFVYLRRIFEDLIKKAYERASQDARWRQDNEALFLGKRMSERILLLKDHLPSFLVENREMYGILSKGVHDLTEEECLEYFPVIRNGIELILDEEIERLSKMKKMSLTQKAIEKITSKLGGKDT